VPIEAERPRAVFSPTALDNEHDGMKLEAFGKNGRLWKTDHQFPGIPGYSDHRHQHHRRSSGFLRARVGVHPRTR
jgi:hypothetical protein